MGKNSFYLGDVGNASKMNLILQMLAGVSIAAIAEALSLGIWEIGNTPRYKIYSCFCLPFYYYSKQSWFAAERCPGGAGTNKYIVKFDA